MKKLLTLSTLLISSFTSMGIGLKPNNTNVASAYHNMYVLGDSLSDTGELVGVLDQFFKHWFFMPWLKNVEFNGPSYNHHNFSNGPVSVEVLAHKLGLNLTSAWKYHTLWGALTYEHPGNNYAIGGAEFGYDSCFEGKLIYNRFSYNDQVNALLEQHKIQSNDLVVLEGGNNDLLRAVRTKTDKEANDAVADTLTNEKKVINKLLANNINHLLVVNVPNLSNVPEFINNPTNEKTRISKIINSYDQNLATFINTLPKNNKSKVREYDTWKAFDKYLALGKKEGINTTNAVVSINYTSAFSLYVKNLNVTYYSKKDYQSFKNSFFYDEVHPSAWTHNLIGNDLYNMVKNWDNVVL